MSNKIVLLFILISSYAFSQSVNDYQYVIVPTKFSIFKENDRYRLNTTTKMMLEKYGFKTFWSTDNLPNEIGDNCQRLYADLEQDKSFLSTKVKIVLKDCKENIIYETDFGASREKEYALGYNEALRETSKSFDKLSYKYNGKNEVSNQVAPVKTESNISSKAPVQASTPDVVPASSPSTAASEVFYFAQPIANGFQVINNEPKVIMKMYNTSVKNIFIASKDNKNGVVIPKDGQWFFEYYENGKLVSELLKLKF